MSSEPSPSLPLSELTRKQRRVLGVLVEKAFTTPEAYPLTLKATTTGCNQKSNRDPVTSYDEDTVADTLEELRQMGLVAVVHTESGRTERFRHYMRHRFTLTEPQLAILTELLLRGRQQVGELRARASRMVPIESLEQLREELSGLIEMKFAQTTGPLERRGVEVDHNLYTPGEGQKLRYTADEATAVAETRAVPAPSAASRPSASPAGESLIARVEALEATAAQFQVDNQELRGELDAVRDELRQMQDRMDDLRRDLGG